MNVHIIKKGETMKYKKIKHGPYNLHIIKTDRFKVNRLVISFKRKTIKEEITIRNFLSDMLVTSCKKYNTQRLMDIESSKLYGIPYGNSAYISGKYSMMLFSMEFLNDKYTEEPIFEDAVNFMMNIIFNPNVDNNQFDEKIFKLCKKNIENSIKSYSDNPRRLSIRRLMENMDANELISYHADGYIEDLDKITPASLYEYYKSILKKDLVDVFVLGDVQFNDVQNIMKEKMKINTIHKTSGSHTITHTSFRKRPKSVIEQKNINQSKLALGFKIKGATVYELNFVSGIYSYILGGGTDSLLFKNVREKNSLCYYINSNIYKVSNLMVIESGINKENYKKTVSLIKKEIKNMMLGNFNDKCIENGKITYLNACKDIYDSPSSLLNVYITNEYLNSGLLEDREKEIMKVTKKDIVNFAKKISLDTIYLLEGSDDDE